ncbi:Clp protease ClpP, partial [Mycobacteroides abscessus subsp. abscessus]
DNDAITVRINSPGGSVFDGIAILNALRDHPATVTVVVDSLAASIASVIAMAGDEIVMNRNSQLMVHNAWAVCVGDARAMEKSAARLAQHNSN